MEIHGEKHATLNKHFDAIHEGLRDAIGIVELIDQPLFDQNLIDKFRQTRASFAFELNRQMLHKAGIFLVYRLWDKGGDAKSIPNLADIVLSSDYRQKIIERRRSAMLSLKTEWPKLPNVDLKRDYGAIERIANEDADRAELDAISQINELEALYKSSEEAEIRIRLLALRHRIAHAIEISGLEKRRAEKGTPIANAKWGDLARVVSHTERVTVLLGLLSQDLSVDYSDDHDVWKTYASSFWNSIRDPK